MEVRPRTFDRRSDLHQIQMKTQIRYLKEMKKVLYDQKWAKRIKDFPVYYVWQGVKTENSLRYDITSIPSRMLGEEFPKTKGHCHKKKEKEIYRVLTGKAFFLLQKGRGEIVEDVYVVPTEKGKFFIIPPGYHHLTINPSKKALKMGNWVSKKCQNDYGLFEKLQGACYYYTKQGWLLNKNYKKVPKIRFEKPLKKKPKSLDFLK